MGTSDVEETATVGPRLTAGTIRQEPSGLRPSDSHEAGLSAFLLVVAVRRHPPFEVDTPLLTERAEAVPVRRVGEDCPAEDDREHPPNSSETPARNTALATERTDGSRRPTRPAVRRPFVPPRRYRRNGLRAGESTGSDGRFDRITWSKGRPKLGRYGLCHRSPCQTTATYLATVGKTQGMTAFAVRRHCHG